jgi:hypothetical protein
MKIGIGLAGVLLIAACGGEGASATDAGGAIERELFVQTYVELRIESFDNSPQIISDGEREQVLTERGVSDEELRHFLDVHGSDVVFMRDVWADIEAQILSFLRPAEDSMGTDSDMNLPSS